MPGNLQRSISLVLLFAMLIVQCPVVSVHAEQITEESVVLLEETQPETEEDASVPEETVDITVETEAPTAETTVETTEETMVETEPATEPTEPLLLEPLPEEQELLESAGQVEEEFLLPMEIPDDLSPEVAQLVGTEEYANAGPVELPSYYDSRDSGRITSVKNQGSYGLCWAFSALAVGESWLITDEQADASIDLSERHLGYFSSGDAYDPLGNATGDSTTLLLYGGDYLKTGFNNKYTTFLLANWVGAAEEAAYPYLEDPAGHDASAAVDDVAHLTNAYWINAKLDKDNMKYFILRNGSVGLSFYCKSSLPNAYYNSTTAAYYSDDFESTNHAITVVGWDDDFSSVNFKKQPPGDGAWLCKNSYGTTSSFGKDGYFWLSYYDSSINLSNSTAFVFEFDSALTYDRNYHYDGSYGTGMQTLPSGSSFANVYSAAGGEEEIRAVGIGLYSADVNYSIQIYKNPTDPACPTSGTPVFAEEQQGSTSLGGYYTVELEEPVTVFDGETFAVVFTLEKKNGGSVSVFTDENSKSSWIQFATRTEKNQSFSRSAGGNWSDLADTGKTARIKAYTVVTNTVPASGLSFETERVELTIDETATQKPKLLPENAARCFLDWSSSDAAVASVDGSGKVTARSPGEAAITAAIRGSTISASYLVSVKPAIQSVNILSPRTQMLAGETFTPQAEIKPASAAPYYSLTVTSSNEAVASVTDNVIHAVAPGTAVIRVSAGKVWAEYTLRVTISLENARITVQEVPFLGQPVRPAVTVTLGAESLTQGRDYLLEYRDNSKPGTGTVQVRGTGNYSGTASAVFPVRVPVTAIQSVQNEASGIRVTWDAVSGSSGYDLYRRTETGSWKKIASISGGTQCDYLDRTGLSSGTMYEYRISTRAGKTYASDYSETKSLYRLNKPSISKVSTEETGFRVTWRAVSKAEGYRVMRSEDGAPAVEIGRVEDVKYPDYLDESATETDVRYTYTILACKGAGDAVSESAESASRSVCQPSVVELQQLQNEAGGITINWHQSPVATGYLIYRSTDGTKWSKLKTISSGSELSWTDTRCSSGVRYYYSVRVCVQLDGVTYLSALSDALTISRIASPRIKTMAKTGAGFEMSWGKVTGAESYLVERRAELDGTVEIQRFDVGTALRFTDSNATELDVIYKYYVTALRQEDASAPSKAARACNPGTPELLSAVNTSKGIALQWEQATSSGYVVYRSTDGVKWTKARTVYGGSTLSWTDTGRRAGTQYLYRVESFLKLDGVSYRSAPSEPLACYRLTMPALQKVTVLEDGGCRITWKKAAGADRYLLMRSEDDKPPVLVATIASGLEPAYLDASANGYGIKYTYTVVAARQAGERLDVSCESAGKSVCRLSATVLNSVEPSGRSAVLRWEPVTLAQGYRVYRSSDGRSWSLRKTVNGHDTLTWTDTSRAASRAYYYRIVATGKLDGVTYVSQPSNEIQG